MRKTVESYWNFVPLVVITLAFIIFNTSEAYCADLKSEDKTTDSAFVFERIQSVDMSKKDIISNSVAFIAEKFVSAKSVIQLKDPDLGKIVGDIVLMNTKAGFLDAFHGIKTRLVLDAKDGKYRLQMSNVVATDRNGIESGWGQIEGANRYRIEPMAQLVLSEFSDELLSYLKKAKTNASW